jgi:hypothetical protein
MLQAGNKSEERSVTMSEEKTDTLPLICRMCKAGLVNYACKPCPPLSADDLPMTEEEAHALNVQLRYNEEATGIISNVGPETRQYFIELKKKLGL